MNPHDKLVERSRALHRAVAEKIRSNPALLQIARTNVARWMQDQSQHGPVSPALSEWKKILETRSLEQVLELVCSESEQADRLRHATPFSGILTKAERSAICEAHAALPA